MAILIFQIFAGIYQKNEETKCDSSACKEVQEKESCSGKGDIHLANLPAKCLKYYFK